MINFAVTTKQRKGGDTMEKGKGQSGFTLIELLVVVAIIAILAAIAIPQYAKYRERAAKASAISDAKNIGTSLEAYFADKQSYPNDITLNPSVATFGDETFSLSKNNTLAGYGTLTNGTGYTFTVVNTVYNKSVTYNSTTGGLDETTWQ